MADVARDEASGDVAVMPSISTRACASERQAPVSDHRLGALLQKSVRGRSAIIDCRR